MASPVRVRFAPSPTGHLHVGNARTALFNWLFARRRAGTYVLRIEDTDVERSEARFEAQLLEDLHWLGLGWDEGPAIPEAGLPARGDFGPYRQSDRMDVYKRYAARLLSQGKAYYCFCTPDELEAERKAAIASHRPQVYSGKCRALDAQEAAQRAAAGQPAAIRLRIPDEAIRFHDIVHGPVEFAAETVSDPILIRSTGMPVYNYVVVIDDIEMRITHVIRGDDHLSNTPKQVALYHALEAAVPEFAHLSTILGADRERLSKRHGATSIASFREMGILPEALVNYLALLGWAPSGGTRETFTLAELVQEFSLERVTPSPAVFDFQKLYWLNRHYISQAEPARLLPLALPHFAAVLPTTRAEDLDPTIKDWFQRLLALILPSVDKLDELPTRAVLFFNYNAAAARANQDNATVLASPTAEKVLTTFHRLLEADDPAPVTAERFKAIVNQVKTESGAKGKDLFHPIRIAITGSHSGPEFDKLIPLIEEGSTLPLPTPIPSVRQRVHAFLHSE